MVRIAPTVRRTRRPRPPASGLFSIAELARAADEPAHVIRYYCRIGLLAPNQRSANGYRRFETCALKHLQFIRRAQGLGFTLDEIGEIFRHTKSGRSPCPEVRTIIAHRVPQVTQQLDALVALHQRMRRALKRWHRLPDAVPSGDAVCALIESDDAPPRRRGAQSAV